MKFTTITVLIICAVAVVLTAAYLFEPGKTDMEPQTFRSWIDNAVFGELDGIGDKDEPKPEPIPIKVPKKEIAYVEYTPYKEDITYTDGTGVMKIYAGPRFSDSKGTLFSEEPSLKDCEFCDLIKIKKIEDKKYPVEIMDYNATSIRICVNSTKENKEETIPLKVYEADNILASKLDTTVSFTEQANSKCYTLPFNKDFVIKYGLNSTYIQYDTTVGDGSMYATNATYNTVHDGASAISKLDTGTTATVMNMKAGTPYYIQRAFLVFDTSTLPPTKNILSANLTLTMHSVSSTGTGQYLGVVNSSQASPTGLALSDFNKCGAVTNPAMGAPKLLVDGVGLKTFVLNATGISWINSEGYTKFGIRAYDDITRVAPTDGSHESQASFNTSEAANPSYLTVSYNLGEVVPTSTFCNKYECNGLEFIRNSLEIDRTKFKSNNWNITFVHISIDGNPGTESAAFNTFIMNGTELSGLYNFNNKISFNDGGTNLTNYNNVADLVVVGTWEAAITTPKLQNLTIPVISFASNWGVANYIANATDDFASTAITLLKNDHYIFSKMSVGSNTVYTSFKDLPGYAKTFNIPYSMVYVNQSGTYGTGIIIPNNTYIRNYYTKNKWFFSPLQDRVADYEDISKNMTARAINWLLMDSVTNRTYGNATIPFSYDTNFNHINLSFRASGIDSQSSVCFMVLNETTPLWRCSNTTGIQLSGNMTTAKVVFKQNTTNISKTATILGMTGIPYYYSEEEPEPPVACSQTPTPSSLTNISQNNNSINIGWTNVAATKYLIYRNATNVVNDTGTPYNNTGLTQDTAYYYSIKAYNASCTIPLSNYSNNISVRTTASPILLGTLSVSLISPTGNINHSQSSFKAYSARVTCTGGSCGNVNLTLDPFSTDYTIEGDTVFVDIAGKGYISQTPHTLYDTSNQPILNFTNNFGESLCLDAAFGFETDKAKPTKAEYLVKNMEHEVVVPDYGYVERYLDCAGTYQVNYGLLPNNMAWCRDANCLLDPPYEDTNLCYWNHTYTRYATNASGARLFYDNYEQTGSHIEYQYYDDYKDISNRFETMNALGKTWYVIQDAMLDDGETITLRPTIEVMPGSDGKYDLILKRCEDTIADAISLDRYVYLDPWFNTSWSYRRNFTVTRPIGAALSNFTMLLKLNATRDFPSAQPDGDDLRMYIDETTPLNYEIEYWNNTAGSKWSYIWVKIPNTFDASEVITIYYNNSAATKGESPQAAWNNNFAAVYHMDDFTATTIMDSKQTWNGTKKGTGEPVLKTDSFINYGQDFDGSNDYINTGDTNYFDSTTIPISFSFWMYSENPTENYAMIFDKLHYAPSVQGWSLGYRATTGQPNFAMYRAGTGVQCIANTAVTINTWQHWTVAYSGSTSNCDGVVWYLNGVVQGTTKAEGTHASGSLDSTVNARFMDREAAAGSLAQAGWLDEVQVYKAQLSTNWINATYKITNAPLSYLSVGSQETTGDEEEPPEPPVANATKLYGVVPIIANWNSSYAFYTNASSNPQDCGSMGDTDTCDITFYVNATGTNGTVHDFWWFALSDTVAQANSTHFDVTINSEAEGPSDPCVYSGTGDWTPDCSCTITTDYNTLPWRTIWTGSGEFRLNADLTTNFTSMQTKAATCRIVIETDDNGRLIMKP